MEHPICWIICWDTVTGVLSTREKEKRVYDEHASIKVEQCSKRKEQKVQLIRSTACSNVGIIAQSYKNILFPSSVWEVVFPSLYQKSE